MFGLTTIQLGLLGAAVVGALVYAGPKVGAKLSAGWAKITGGDLGGGASALADAIRELALVKKIGDVTDTVENIVGYARVKALAGDIIESVAPAKQAEVEAAFQTILTAIAQTNVDEPTPAPVNRSKA